MILTCPSCSAKYNIPEESLGSDGREVRCAKCGHVWHQKSAKNALDDLITQIQSVEMDEILFGSTTNTDKTANKIKQKKSKNKKSLAPFVMSCINAIKHPKAFFTSLKPITQHGFAGFMVGLAVFMCLFYGLVSMRVSVTQAIPATTRVFDNLGFYIPKPSTPNAEKKLAFDHLTLNEKQGEIPSISGQLVNLTADAVAIPAMHIRFLDKSKNTLFSLPYLAPVASIEKEASIPLNIRLTEKLPVGTTSIDIIFTEK